MISLAVSYYLLKKLTDPENVMHICAEILSVRRSRRGVGGIRREMRERCVCVCDGREM